jgi:hypothetical protein
LGGIFDRASSNYFWGGSGGLSAACELRGTTVDAALIDKQNYCLLRPLHYQVAPGLLSRSNWYDFGVEFFALQ